MKFHSPDARLAATGSQNGGWPGEGKPAGAGAGGKHVATYADSTTYFIHADWLGTERARTTAQGGPYETCTSLPFGDGLICSGGDPSPMHFTGKQRDSESGLDYFGARYDSSSLGRFITADWSSAPVAVPYATLTNPQSLNLYTYVGNNPVTDVDADGHATEEEPAAGSGCGDAGPCREGAELAPGGTAEQRAEQQQKLDQDQKQAQNNNNQQTTTNLDKDKVANYMDKHAGGKSQGECAAACRRGLAAGGMDTKGHPGEAKDYGPFLEKHGATVVSQDNYKPQKGDVAVFEGNDAHKQGHVEIYDGKQWVSDFKQKNFSPYTKDTPPSTVYRFPDSN